MPPTSRRRRSAAGERDNPGGVAGPEFDRLVRDAIAHLNDPVHLQTHPLARLMPAGQGQEDRDPGRALQRALLDAVDALRPPRPLPGDPGGRRYQVLVLHYVEGIASPQVRKELGVGDHTYYRDHRRALRAVTSLLRKRWAAPEEASLPQPGGDPAGAAPPAPADAAGAPPPARDNLPAPCTSFVGRDSDVAALAHSITASEIDRLVTLTGPGGCGKTRLAIEAARALAGRFPDGVWLVELAATADPAQVDDVVARTLGVPTCPDRPPLDALLEAMRDRRALLVLDNCEHLLGTCARLVGGLLAWCPGVRILATSREPLWLRGETVRQVAPLAVPPDAPLSAEAVAGYDAVRLFVDRAAALDGQFALTDANAGAIGRICRRLDGIPLAIELAAARASALGPEQLAERLDDRFALLTWGDPTLPPRQQTLRAALDWSHDLLAAPERVLFRRLATFRGGWTLDAAEAACAGEPLAARAIPDVMTRLVARSLVVAEPGVAAPRYRMLETVHAYALERLEEADETAALQARHLAWCGALVEGTWPGLIGPDEMARLDALERELDNVRAALAWSWAEEHGAAPALDLTSGLTFLWIAKGYLVEGKALLDAAMARKGADRVPRSWARALERLAPRLLPRPARGGALAGRAGARRPARRGRAEGPHPVLERSGHRRAGAARPRRGALPPRGGRRPEPHGRGPAKPRRLPRPPRHGGARGGPAGRGARPLRPQPRALAPPGGLLEPRLVAPEPGAPRDG